MVKKGEQPNISYLQVLFEQKNRETQNTEDEKERNVAPYLLTSEDEKTIFL